jgi:hypothetical protein
MSTRVDDASVLASWRVQFKVIYLDVQDLAEQRDIFRELMEIVEGIPGIEKLDTRAIAWMQRMYSHWAAVAVRKQVDRDTRTVSLRRLLSAIATRPNLVTRAEYVSRAKSNRDPSTEYGAMELEELRGFMHKSFDEFLGVGVDELTRDAVALDLAALDDAAGAIQHFVNNTVAHRNRTLRPTATWDELNGAIDTILRLLRKYNALLDAGEAPNPVPRYQYNWKAIFRVAWLPDPRATRRATLG